MSIYFATYMKIVSNSIEIPEVTPFIHNVEKYEGVNTARFSKYVWPFFNIMNERLT